jgi:DNA invertase Pin-like site-specific DNA recombinase
MLRGQGIAYDRVRSFDQNLERQLDLAQLDKLFTDKASGKDAQRPQLDLLSPAREGDSVIVRSMDRLARNLDDLRRLVQTLTKRRIRIEFFKECVNFNREDLSRTSLLLSVMEAFAKFPAGIDE